MQPLIASLLVAAGVFWWHASQTGVDFMSALYAVNHECMWNSPVVRALLAGMLAFIVLSCWRRAGSSFSASLSDFDLMDTRT